MPSASHPQAQFVPIPPDFDVNALVENTDNFDYVTRLSREQLKEHSIQNFEALVLAVVIQSGKPLVIEDWPEECLPSWLFSSKWLEDNLGTKPEKVRDISNGVDIPMTMGHYLRSMGQLTKQFNSSTYRDPKRQRLYMKDIDCPDMWAQKLREEMPGSVYYLNECIESRTGGDGAIREPNEYGQMRFGNGVAPAGDLMSSLPPDMRALNMMCYIGHEGTYTPAHREMCASLGHNIMVDSSRDGHGEKEGSSIWFMTETKEREVVSEYFLSMLGHDIEVEKHFAQVNAWKKAPFNVWVVEQKVGDLILIPPLAPHQVWNRGTRTMKAAWNRTTVDTLELAIHEALPRGRMVCRDEQYKNKAIIYYTLEKYWRLMQRDTIEAKMWKYGRIKQLLDDFKRLFSLYTEVLVSEMFSPKLPEELNVEYLPFDSNVTCSYCRCNIFNRFLTCKSCIERGPNGEEDTYDICMDCYAMGRSCACISGLDWVEQWKWDTLTQNYENWRNTVVQADGHFDIQRSPQPLEVARKRYGRKPIAEVCQEQLKIRPWTDITKPVVREPSPGMSDVEPEVDDNGRPRNKKKGKFSRRKLQAVKNKTHTCHVCMHHEWNWKLAFCSTCSLAYCYGVLWRAFDLMPQTVMEDKDWQCPRCMKMCSCGKCRKTDTQKPYEPKGTLLGHDTKKVADFRSVESLVDFSRTNLTWLREDVDSPEQTSRMKKLKEKAEADKARVDDVNGSYVDDGQQDPFLGGASGEPNALPPADMAVMDDIDPSLRDAGDFPPNGHANGYSNFFDQDPAIAGNGELNHFNGEGNAHTGEDQHGWMDGHYELDDNYDSVNNQNTSYPSGLLAPVAPMFDEEGSYLEPPHGQTRMMGIGYYQQGHGVDDIVYDPPNANDTMDDFSQPAPLQQTVNLIALSDIYPEHPAPAENPKKRKRVGEGSDDEEDAEFFASKKQKKTDRSKKSNLVKSDISDMPVLRDGTQRQPRRSAVKPTIYTDLGEDAVPIEDDEGPSAVSTSRPKKVQTEDDLQLAAMAMSRLINPVEGSPDGVVPKKRGRKPGSKNVRKSESPAIVTPKPQPKPRQSAWLARKEAQGSDNDDPEEIPSVRPRRSLAAQDKEKTTIDIASDSVEPNDDADIETDSLFGEPIERAKTVESRNSDEDFVEENDMPAVARPAESEVDSDGDVEWRPSKDHPNVQVAEVKSAGKPPAKRRGRPPKQAKARSPSPEMAQPAPIPKMMSLREKLALKGKSFKIVSSKTRKSIEGTPAPLSAVSTPSVAIPGQSSVRSTPSVAVPGPSSARDTPSAAVPGPSSTRNTPAVAAPDPSSTRNTPSVAVPGPSSLRSTPSIAIPAFGSQSPMSPEPDHWDSFNNLPNIASSRGPTPSSAKPSDMGSKSTSRAPSRLGRLHDSLESTPSYRGSPQPVRLDDAMESAPASRAPSQPVRLRDSMESTPASLQSGRPIRLSDGKENSPVSRTPAQPVKKGPTVVRLDSPGSESSYGSAGYLSDGQGNQPSESEPETPALDEESHSDSDASIPAVRPSPHKAIRGRGGASLGRRETGGIANHTVSMRGRGRGRPRGRPSLKASN